MELNNYLIIGKDYIVYTIQAADAKEALYEYVCDVGIRIDKSLFKKAIEALTIEEAVELFEEVCLSDNDRISRILYGYSTLYDDGEPK